MDNLPADAAMRDPVEWTVDNELGALLVERVHEAVRYLAVMVRLWADDRSRSRVTVPEALHLPRPGEHDLEPVPEPDPEEWPPRMRVRSGRELMGRFLEQANGRG